MRDDVFTRNNSVRTVSDRRQRIAFSVCLAGLFINTVLFALYLLNDTPNLLLVANFAFYTGVIAAIAWSSYRNRYFTLVLGGGVAAIYIHMWATAFFDAFMGQASTLTFPTLLFAPLFLVLVMGHRLLLMNAAIQGAAVYLYAKYFAAEVFGLGAEAVATNTFAIQLSVLSTMSMLVLAGVAFSRRRTDERLLSLLRHSERMAAHDPLTGLKNRRAFLDDIDKFWSAQSRFAVLFIDLDRFKPLNDEFGHAVGDQVLYEIGKRLTKAKGVMTAARFGGDEFAAVLDAPHEAAVELIVEDIFQSVTARIEVESAMVSVGASLGFAFAFEDASSVSDLLHAADIAMMRSKANGGGIAKFDTTKDDSSLASSAIQELFRSALSSGRIKAALQPVFDPTGQTIIGHELLSRWPESGLKRDPSPLEFIGIAEKLGLLNELLWTTLAQVAPYLRSHPGFLAINVSPSQFSARSFATELQSKLADLSLSLDRIEIEITEHVAFRNLDENRKVLEELRDMGCRIVLDDFGAGYSSLSLLDQLPLDKVKLDKSLQSSRHTEGVLDATMRLVRDLGFECCVEGIESEEIFDRVSQSACHQLQGFWLGRPEIVQLEEPYLKLVS